MEQRLEQKVEVDADAIKIVRDKVAEGLFGLVMLMGYPIGSSPLLRQACDYHCIAVFQLISINDNIKKSYKPAPFWSCR